VLNSVSALRSIATMSCVNASATVTDGPYLIQAVDGLETVVGEGNSAVVAPVLFAHGHDEIARW